jgi:hypothetical protein
MKGGGGISKVGLISLALCICPKSNYIGRSRSEWPGDLSRIGRWFSIIVLYLVSIIFVFTSSGVGGGIWIWEWEV